jgi:putative spermidine/putrescine transport system ATP-binding protein
VEIKRIHREVGITMVYVTHDQTEAMTMSDRLAVFCNGKVEQVGSPLDVYNRPVNRFVGEFIGDSNFFAGRVDASRPGSIELTGIGPVRVAANAVLPSGNVDLMIRPERLRLCAAGDSGGADNTLSMTVDDVINYGDSILVIGTTNGLPLRARLMGRQMGGQGEPPAHGATLTLAWAPQDAHVLPRASGP